MARKQVTKISMPKQYVRPGRGSAGYKAAEGETIEEFETPDFRRMTASAKPAKGSADSGPNIKQLRAEAGELKISGASRMNKASLEAAIAAAKQGDNEDDDDD